jgi:hypothetical protein
MQLSLWLLAALLLAGWFWLRRRATARREQQEQAARLTKVTDTTYHAIAIRSPKDACAAAKALAGQRFLASEAPNLPLPACDAATCECHFAHYDDRRSGKDRRTPFGAGAIGGGTGRFEKERRETPDRRRNAGTDSF